MKDIELTYGVREQFMIDCELFSGIDDELVKEIEENIEYKSVERGQLVFENGDPGDKFYMILSGKMKVYENKIDGAETVLYIYSAGEFIGAHNMLESVDYIYNAECIETGIIATLDKEYFDEYIKNNTALLKNILHMSYRRIRFAENQIYRLTSSNMEMKVARLLYELIPEFGIVKGNNEVHLHLAMNRTELASMNGIARETLTRKLGDFRQDGLLLSVGHRLIIIKDVRRLKEIAEKGE